MTQPKSKLLLPSASLANCLFGAFVRDLRGCDLTPDKRYNFFASSPLCAISWTFEGDGYLLSREEQFDDPTSTQIFPKIAFSGPYETPQISWSEGNFYAITLAFYPDAFAAITDIDISRYANRSVPVDEVLSGNLLEVVKNAAFSNDAENAFKAMENELIPLWAANRVESPIFGHLVDDWCRMLAVRAALSGVGKSTRQIERRFRSWTGHSRQKLLAYAKGEQAFQYALDKKAAGTLNLAEMSADLGYSDQSHMGRRVKEITGFSPAEFMERYENDEAFWCFRLMGERI